MIDPQKAPENPWSKASFLKPSDRCWNDLVVRLIQLSKNGVKVFIHVLTNSSQY